MPFRRRWTIRLSLLLLSLTLGAALLELGLRLTDPWGARFKIPMWTFVREAKRPHPDPRLAWSFTPGVTGHYGVPVRLNRLGFRGPEWGPPRPGVKRALVLGDSFAFGYSVREEEGFPAVIGRGLGPAWEVLNAGVIGYNTDQEWRILQTEGWAASPDMVLLILIANDWDPTLQAPGMEEARTASATWRRKHPLKWFIREGPHAGLDYTFLYLFHYLQWKYRYFGDNATLPNLPWTTFSDGDAGWQACRRALAGMQSECRDRGVPFRVLLHEDEPHVRACLEELGIVHRVLHRDYASAVRHALCPLDAHPDAEGHRLIGEAFLSLVREP